MSKARIEQYYRETEEATKLGGSAKESSMRRYFANLLEFYAKNNNLTLIDEKVFENKEGKKKYPDGTLQFKAVNAGHWESKDAQDDLEKEILKKFDVGYPQYNILFENSLKAVLYQAPTRFSQGARVMEVNMKNWRELDAVLKAFTAYQTEEVHRFRDALDKFKESVPGIGKILKAIIAISAGEKTFDDFDTALQLSLADAQKSPEMIENRNNFWQTCKNSINPHISLTDIDEMIIQHILTENIFNTIFGENRMHRENNIALEVSKIIDSFFNKNLRRNTVNLLNDCYAAIVENAKNIQSYQEKQRFLKLIYEEFYEAYNPQGAGVCIAFFVKIEERADEKCRIFYYSLPDEMRKVDKLHFLQTTDRLKDVPFERIRPDKNGNWLNITENDFETLVPVASKIRKSEHVIFEMSSLGVSTNRDEWVYDFSKTNLQNKVNFFVEKYNELMKNEDFSWKTDIKWSRDLKKKFTQKKKLKFDKRKIILAYYRPFVKKFWYAGKPINDILTKNHYEIFGDKLQKNLFIAQIGDVSQKPFSVLVGNLPPNLNYLSPSSVCRVFALQIYENGERKENITDWALDLFRQTYIISENLTGLEKIDIFHYVYAVLLNPEYRKKYEQNLKRDFPRVPLYVDFWKWANWGKKLMDLHLNFEIATPFPLQREDKSMRVPISGLKTKLKADKQAGIIILDEQTDLVGIPALAWEYKLGNRSALEWILDQYKENTPSDATIAEQFNTYKFADYKEQVIDLLKRVCRVSVETMEIVEEMSQEAIIGKLI